MAELIARESLGMVGNKHYFWNFEKNIIEWSVPNPRAAVVAEPGYRILASDYAQIEVKLMAFSSGDPILIAAINSGLDIHTFNATAVFGERYKFTYEEMETAREDPTHPRFDQLSTIRSRIKTVTFGVPYGAGPTKVAFMTGMTVDEAKEFIRDFFDKFKVLRQWLESQGIFAVDEGYSATPRGRKRFYELPALNDPKYEEVVAQIKRWAGNMPIQGGNADILKLAMNAIYLELRGGSYTAKKLYDARFLLVVHDEIVMVVREDHVPQVKAIMAKCMNAAYHKIVPAYGNPGWIALGPEKYDWGVKVVEAYIWAKA